jgi:hypothetical protein
MSALFQFSVVAGPHSKEDVFFDKRYYVGHIAEK